MKGRFYHHETVVGTCEIVKHSYRGPTSISEGIASTPGYFVTLTDLEWNAGITKAVGPRSLVLEFYDGGCEYLMGELQVVEEEVLYGVKTIVAFSPDKHITKMNGLKRASREAWRKTR